MLRVVNWSSFQSYKDRKPPWIRLHKTLLDNYEFQSMSANARAVLPMLWLLASEDEDPLSGVIPYSIEKISFRLRISIKDINAAIEETIANGFIEQNQSCNETVTETLRNRTQTVTTETEKRQRKEKCVFGEFQNVKLTDDEYAKLQTRLNGSCQKYIENLSRYIATKGDKYKSHYAAILNFADRDGFGKQKPECLPL